MKNQLTKKEKQVFMLLVKYGYDYKTIAFMQGVGLQAIKKHVHNILKKVKCDSTLEMVVKYYRSK